MKLAVEAPLSYLNIVSQLTDFNFVLAHLVLSNEQYRNFYCSSSKFTMLDCSTFELGHPVPTNSLLEAASIIHPDVVIAPDVLHNMVETKKKLEYFLKQLPDVNFRIGAVLQGRTIQEFKTLYNFVLTIKNLSYICIPYDVELEETKQIKKPEIRHLIGRLAVLTMISKNISSKHNYHLLGVGSPLEFLITRTFQFITSVDTSAPIVMAIYNIKNPYMVVDKLVRPSNYFYLDYNKEVEKRIVDSLIKFKNIIG